MLFLKLALISIRSEMQYPASFCMLLFSYFLSTFIDIIGIWILFDRFEMIVGWTLAELALIYGIIQMGFSLSEVFARGFDKFFLLVQSGDFDRILLRPQKTLMQIAARDLQLMRLGRFFQGLAVLYWGVMTQFTAISFYQVLLIAFSVLGSIALFYALFIMQATLSFWTVEALEVMNIATYGGLRAGQYPITIYPRGFRLFFTFVIPLASVAYYPVASLLDHEAYSLWQAYLFPLSGFIFFFIATKFWHFGVHHYHSTGS